MLLFSIDERRGIILHPDAVKLEPTLKKVKAADMLYIILAHDYFSPYRQLIDIQRRLTASRVALNSDDWPDAEKRLDKAIETYRSLQYDIRRETVRNYTAKIATLNLTLQAEDDPTKIKRIHDSIEFLTRAVNRIEKDLTLDELAAGDEKMSFLERFQENQRRFNNDKKQIDLHRQKVEARKDPDDD